MLKADEKKNQHRHTILLTKAPIKQSKEIKRAGVLIVVLSEERACRYRNMGRKGLLTLSLT